MTCLNIKMLKPENICMDQKAVSEDYNNRYMFDGRLIQQYLQFISPNLRVPVTSDRTHVASNFSCNSTMNKSSLRFLFDLSFYKDENSNYFLRRLDSSHVVTHGTEYGIVFSAKEFIKTVMHTEHNVLNDDYVYFETDLAILPNIFSEFVNYEHNRRCGIESDIPMISSEELISVLQKCRLQLTKDMICYWYPLWSRTEWINNSPYDYMIELNNLYDATCYKHEQHDVRRVVYGV